MKNHAWRISFFQLSPLWYLHHQKPEARSYGQSGERERKPDTDCHNTTRLILAAHPDSSNHTSCRSWQWLLLKQARCETLFSLKHETELMSADVCSEQSARQRREGMCSDMTVTSKNKEGRRKRGQRKRGGKQWTCEMEIKSSLTPLSLMLLFTATASLLHSRLKSMNIATANSLL